MKKLNFSIHINASAAQVWQILWNSDTYRQWTAVFQEGSYAESDWQEGSKILFLDGKGSGMISRIERKIPNEFMSFVHLGMVKDGTEDFKSAEEQGWAGSMENYTLTEKDNGTFLEVSTDTVDSFEAYMNEKFPLAINQVKILAEAYKKPTITVEATISAPIEKVWKKWTNPEDIKAWNNASDDWHTPEASNDLRVGGTFVYKMAAKDGSFSFDFSGVYDAVDTHKFIAYTIVDGRKVHIKFIEKGNKTLVSETFEAENENSLELQQAGWQAILNNFKEHVEKSKKEKEQKIKPFLWFNDNAEEAVTFYTTVFDDSKLQKAMRMPDGKVLTVSFHLGGQEFVALNGGPKYQFTPATSFFIMCDSEDEVNTTWAKLSEGGQVMMPLNKYEWSAWYGWCQDRFGLSWQVMLAQDGTFPQKFIPCWMFSGDILAQANDAIKLYTSLFKNSKVNTISRYEVGEPAPEGSVKYAEFSLNSQVFTIMGSPPVHKFTFNEAVSFVINCKNQEEIDYYWDKLTADGGAESQCGWLKDKYGISWQVVPTNLSKLLAKPNAMQAMLKMKKLDIKALEKA
jgi:predicted 3-demethylubiquinone-9 3-methyltransferase (glyoxalase superfamily)